jgi:hypothetical protein
MQTVIFIMGKYQQIEREKLTIGSMRQVNSSFIPIFCRWDAVSLKETRIYLFNVKLAHVFWLFVSVGCGSLTFTPHLFLMDIVNFQTYS